MWFCVAILKVAEHDGRTIADSLWEEQFFLIECKSEEVARKGVEDMARRPEAPYQNKKGELISWKFVTVESVCAVEGEIAGQGVEVFSRFLRDSEARSLMVPFGEVKP